MQKFAIDMDDTVSLIQTVEQFKPESRFLVDTFFPNILPASLSESIAIEYRKYGRTLAPYVVPGAHGINIGRTGTIIRQYTPPLLGARRIINAQELMRRQDGEPLTEAGMNYDERAAMIQSRDLRELTSMIANRKNQMAAEILTTGKLTLRGYADDGVTPRDDSITFDWDGKMTPLIPWNQSSADIYRDIEQASEKIQEDAGIVPTVMIVGRNVAQYLMKNAGILSWLSIPSRENFALMSMQPRLTSPQIMRIGLIQALNLEIYSYFETYQDENGKLQRFLGDNQIIIGVPGFGSQAYGAVPILEQDSMSFKTYSAPLIPVYNANPATQTISLTMYSRVVLVPTSVDSWISMNVLEGTSGSNTITGSDNGSEIAETGSDASLPGL